MMRTLGASCLLQFAQGSIMIAGAVTPGIGAPLLQLCSYVGATLVLRVHQFRSVREELLVGGFLLGVVGHLLGGLWGDEKRVLCYSVAGGVGSGILGAAIARVNFYCMQGQSVGILRRTTQLVMPVFWYGMGGMVFLDLGELVEWSMFITGGFIVAAVCLSAFWLLPSGVLTPVILPPPPLQLPPPSALAFFVSTGLFSAFVACTASLPVHALVVNSSGRVASGALAELFGFPVASVVTGLIASTLLATTYTVRGLGFFEPDLWLVLGLGACIGLMGRNQWASVACLVKGSVYFVAVVSIMPRLVELVGVGPLGQTLGACLLLSAASSFGPK